MGYAKSLAKLTFRPKKPACTPKHMHKDDSSVVPDQEQEWRSFFRQFQGEAGMHLFVRNLLLGYFVWLTGELALQKFPKQFMFHQRMSDLVGLLMFKPFHVLFSLMYFLLSCGLLYYLLLTHGRASFLRPSLSSVEKSLHLILFCFSVFLLILHLLKLTLPMIVMISIALIFKIRTMIRTISLQAEIRNYRKRKK